MNRHTRYFRSIVLASVLCAASLVTSAQTFVGSIGGMVKDASGAVVQGAEVIATDTATKVGYKTVTNDSGNYLLSFLKPSDYTVSIEKAGFQKLVTPDLTLVLNQKLRLDSVLRVGNLAQTISVEERATQLNRSEPSIGGELSNADLVAIPEQIGSHGPTELTIAKVFPGLSGSSPDYSNPNNLALGGGRPDTNPIIIDGLPSNMAADGTYGLVPTPDSTEELQVLTAAFSAQYGQTGGGVILTTTKSGTYNLHGALFEYFTNQNLDALNYFTAPGTAAIKNIFNYYGGSLGGPIYIPKLFNGRKHSTFFFTDWENTNNPKGAQLNQDVPTQAELNGNFSGLTAQGTANPIIYDPATTRVVNGKVTRTPFSGNVIPSNRLDPVAAKILSFYPASNCSFSTFNYCVAPTQAHTYLYNVERVDQNFGDYDRVWARFSRDGPTSGVTSYINNAANPSAVNGWQDNQAEVSWSHIFAPTIANEFRAGYVEENNFNTPSDSNVPTLGLQGVPLTQFPTISVSGLYGLGAGAYSRTLDRHFIFNDAVNWQLGRHSLSFGGEFTNYIYKNYSPGVLSGGYSFTGTFTSLPGQATTGLADLELGFPATTTIGTNNYEYSERLNYAGLYLQDDFKLSPKLTINLGLRWEFDGPYAEVNNQMYTFNPTVTDPATGHLGGIQYAGVNGAPNHFSPNNYKGFLPRAGFAYGLPKNTVFRGGYGIYELPSIGFATNNLRSRYSVNASFTSPDGVTPAYELSQGVPPYAYNVNANGLPNVPTSLTNPTSNVADISQQPILPYIQEWEFSLQHQFGGGWFGEIAYQGSKGVHLPVTLNINQIAPTPGCCFGVRNAQSLRPYPQFLNVNYYANEGNSNYNAMLLKLQHYWRNGLSVLFAYTWAKSMDDVDAAARADGVAVQNVYNLRGQYGVAMTDIPQRVSVTWVYDLPFGSNRQFGSHIPVVSQIIGGWQISGIAQFQRGYPYYISQANTLGLFSGAQYVNQVGDPYLSNQTVQKWFNTAAFQIAPANTLGNAPRAALFGPGQENFDLAITRSFPITEHIRFKLRGEFYDALNHPQWSNLNTTITSPGFGSVTSAMDPRVIQVSGRISF